ncbi:MAG: hypothetical protein ACI9JN_001617 [Bacteroidia bacterium]|jgi:hypothetical protein
MSIKELLKYGVIPENIKTDSKLKSHSINQILAEQVVSTMGDRLKNCIVEVEKLSIENKALKNEIVILKSTDFRFKE